MKIAIYSRKSKFTGKGESIENQIQLCKEYALRHFDNITENDFIIYEDEGFSGGNTNRPMFQKLIEEAKLKQFSVLICYRLDRISRNVADFSTTLETLQKFNIDFVSIKEQFDTSTPMGRAMVYISSVFAQLERETIAERVRDNMLELAKSGRWLGGQTPMGFDSEQTVYLDHEYKERSMYKLTPNYEELKTIQLIYDKYLELKSLRKVHTYLLKHNIKTKLGKDWLVSSISSTLSNPVYCMATEEVFNYLRNKGINCVGDPNGLNGVLTYNKKKGHNIYRDEDEWIAAIGKHEGVISSTNWLKIQYILEENKTKAPRLGKTHNVLLSGLLRCAKCGSNMTVVHGRKTEDGKIFYYACSMKQDSKGIRCDNGNIRADEMDLAVINKLKFLSSNKGDLVKDLNSKKKSLKVNNDKETIIKNTNKAIEENETAINNLVGQLSQTSTLASKYLIAEIEKRTEVLEKLKTDLLNITKETIEEKEETTNIDLLISALNQLNKEIDYVDNEQKKNLLNVCLDKVTWDSSLGNIDIRLWSEEGKKK